VPKSLQSFKDRKNVEENYKFKISVTYTVIGIHHFIYPIALEIESPVGEIDKILCSLYAPTKA
jgi:hypothetical protein